MLGTVAKHVSRITSYSPQPAFLREDTVSKQPWRLNNWLKVIHCLTQIGLASKHISSSTKAVLLQVWPTNR